MKPNCANCGEDYIYGHRWAGGAAGDCKRPKGGTKSFYREPGTKSSVRSDGKAGA